MRSITPPPPQARSASRLRLNYSPARPVAPGFRFGFRVYGLQRFGVLGEEDQQKQQEDAAAKIQVRATAVFVSSLAFLTQAGQNPGSLLETILRFCYILKTLLKIKDDRLLVWPQQETRILHFSADSVSFLSTEHSTQS